MSREEHNMGRAAPDNDADQAQFEPPPALRRTLTGELRPYIQANPENLFVCSKNGALYPLDPDLDIDDAEPIGEGGESKIYAALFQFTNKHDDIEQRRCVLRSNGKATNADRSSTIEELVTSSKMSSNECGLLKPMGNIVHQGERYTVFPFCELFLEKIIAALPALKARDPLLYSAIVLHILTGIVESLKFMHEQGYAHRDLKPANIAYYRGEVIFLDFGISCKLNADMRFAGTAGYVHPYCTVDSHFSSTEKNDTYAIGQILKEMLGRKPELVRMIEEKDPAIAQGIISVHKIHEEKYNAALDKEERKNAAWEEFLKIDPTAKRAHRTLSDIITDDTYTFEEKLMKIGISMSSLLPTYQPSVDEVYEACLALKPQIEAALSSTKTQAVLDQEIMDFYDNLSDPGPFPEAFSPRKKSANPITPMEDSMRRVSSFSVAFFSGSGSKSRNSLSSSKNPSTLPSPTNLNKPEPDDDKLDEKLGDSWLMP